ncbi:MAG: hypothetical protein DHS20C11_36210 [Lysobacteraceae bacterium]|nr:MAG: hypothetical protein DHS20C11_36210 [Xanthomonadaceae bacterium]
MNTILKTIAIVLLTFGCGYAQSSDHNDHHHAAAVDGLTLNHGQRWLMDEHTRKAFEQMESGFSKIEVGTATEEQLLAAATQLKQDLRLLIKGCTMTGAAHDQLHHYLVSYMPAVDRLALSGDVEDAELVAELLAVFPRYFK